MLESPTSQAYTRIGRNVCPIPIADRVVLGWLLETRVFHCRALLKWIKTQ